ncbi:MAG: hypothetical protein V3T83_16840, partial [Acidobacteriota bacterium]
RRFPATFRSLFDEEKQYIHVYTYLRGIDGQIPGAKKSNDGSQASGGISSAGILSAAQIERAEGRSQYDYLRRMEQQLADTRQQGDIRAVGVTGTDVYDKLLILRALRSSFRDTLFFTTDLDVRLLHPSEYDSVRNLLIASHFSLGLGADRAAEEERALAEDKASAQEESQQSSQTLEDQFADFSGADADAARGGRHVPLFRYSYQSSVFLAALLSLNPSRAQDGSSVPSHARLYEVGRNGEILLNAKGKLGQKPPGPVLALILVLASIGWGLLVRKLSAGISLFLGWLLPFAVLAAIAALDSMSRGGEAWAVFEGVSLWPSQFLLLLIIMLAIEFAIRLVKGFEASKLKLDLTYFNINPKGRRRKDFQLTLPEDLSGRIRFCWHEFKAQAFTELHLVGTYVTAARDNPHHREGRTVVLGLWKDYRQRTSPGAIFLRLALYAWLVIPVTGLIFYSVPARPFRGDLSLWVDRGLLAAVLLAIGFLIVLVWDVTLFTSLFTRNLAGRESLWPKSTVQAYSKKGWPEESYSGELINEWLDVNFIARHTKSIGSFIYFPLILLLLYAVAHHSIFDNWVFRPQEMMLFMGTMLLALVPLIKMHRSAESARRQARERLGVKTMEAQGQQDSGPRLRILQGCLDDIEAIRQGAFSSLAENPLLRAALIPFGGMGGLALLDFMLL